MVSPGSVTFWIAQLKAGQRQAVQKLWESYFPRLVALARVKLRSGPRQVADEEDVALSAFDSFCRAVKEGRFPKLEDRDDLWQLLVLLAGRKAANLVKHERVKKRGAGQVRPLPAPPAEEEDGAFFAGLIGKEPDPALAAEVADECERLLGVLEEEPLRQIALWKLEGYSNEEIGAKMGRAVPTVERKLKRIRDCWAQHLSGDEKK